MYEPILQLLAGTIMAYDPNRETPRRTGSRVHGGVPRNVYRTRDSEWVAVSGTTDAQVARLLPLIGSDTAANRARFGRSAERLAAADELDGLVADWIAAHDHDDVIDAFLGARIPAAPVNDLPAILDDPHVSARASLVHVDDDELGPLTMPAPIPRLSATPGRVRATGPKLGAHNDEVIPEWLELDPAEVVELRRASGV
jgi:crotonobetainyl-CoA:carnitine CoA-transferase CaiB-like acyl-CoA transferase